MPLNARQLQAREGKMTASRVGTLFTGTDQEVYDLWLELTGDPVGLQKAEELRQELESDWGVQLGATTEKLHLDWLARTYGQIKGRGKSFQHPDVTWAMCTLDGWVEDKQIPVEVKHNNGFDKMDDIIKKYLPQMHWTMYVTDTEEILFSAIRGARQPDPYIIKQDEAFLHSMVKRAEEFMRHVHMLTEPGPNPYIEMPRVEAVRIADMTGNNLWATAATRWKENLEAHKAFEYANKELKTAMPADAKEAFGHGVYAKRNKAGSITIKPQKEEMERPNDGQDERTSDAA